MDGEKVKKINKKNYIILFVVIVFTLLLAICLRNIYINQKSQDNNPYIEHVYQIDEHSLSNYVIENNSFILYVADTSEEEIKSFEKKLGKYLTKKEYNKDIIYLDLNDVDVSFYSKFKKKYFHKRLSNINLMKQTNLLYFEDKKVVDVLYTDYSKLNIDDFEDFIDKHADMEIEK